MDAVLFWGLLRTKGYNIAKLCAETKIPRSRMYRRLETNGRTMTLGEVDRIRHVLGLTERETTEVFLR